jgi:hypothetical protein
MKRLALGLVVLLCVCASAYADTVEQKYTFDNLPSPGSVINGQRESRVTWVGIVNAGKSYVLGGLTPDYDATATTSTQEQLVGTLRDGVGGAQVINLTATDTLLYISYRGLMNVTQGGLVGIWIDGGLDPNFPDANNTIANNNFELLCQFGISSGKWRIRGANGVNSVNTLNTGIAPATTLYDMQVILKVDLAANAGNGAMSLRIIDLTNGGPQIRPVGYQNIAMGLLADTEYQDPTKYTGWWFRSQASGYTASVGGMTMDDFRITPEPATLTLLVLGVGALVFRRPRK